MKQRGIMAKATTSAVDFLQMMSGGTELFETDGVTVELRGLTFTESQQLVEKYKDNNTELTFQALLLGLVEPKLDEAQLQQLRNARPGPLMKIAKRVITISGMGEDDGPLAPGGGLSS